MSDTPRTDAAVAKFIKRTYTGACECVDAEDMRHLERENEALRKDAELALSQAREEGRLAGMREAAEMVDEALERAAVLTLKRTAYAPDAEAIRKLKEKNNG